MLETKSAVSQDYRDAMAQYAGHVQLVTTVFNGVRRGVTVTAACSVSDNPPIVLICLNRSHQANSIFLDSGVFAINTLAVQHQALAASFAGLDGKAMEDRFAMADWDFVTTGAPTLTDANAVFDCRLLERKDMATHMVLFGEVVGMRVGNGAPALMFLNREWRSL